MNQITPIVAADLAPDTVVERIRALLPEIEARADEIEDKARVPQDLLQRLETAGAFRLCVPKMFGGEELPIGEFAGVLEDIAAADASVAWHVMVAAGSQVITARLPAASLREYYANGPDVWPKAAAAPKAIATPVEGGYRLSGRWQLASGARPFEWISLGFFIKDADGLRRGPDGRPDLRFCLVPRGDARVIETWDAVGLRGTRSDDIEVEDLFVPEAWQASLFGKASLDAPILGISMPAATAPHHSSVVKGILKAAVRDLALDSYGRKPSFSPTTLMKDDAVFQSRFGEIATRIDALGALADRCTSLLDACNREGRNVTSDEAVRISSAETLVHQEATGLMDQIMMLSGSAGVYASSRQQRRWRDLRCAAQHQAANIGQYASYARSIVAQVAS